MSDVNTLLEFSSAQTTRELAHKLPLSSLKIFLEDLIVYIETLDSR